MQQVIEIVDKGGKKSLALVQYEEVLMAKCYVDRLPNQSIAERLQKIKDLKYSEGDVLLCSYPKTGTHWATNLLSLLFYTGPMEDSPSFELRSIDGPKAEDNCSLPSPKVISSHLLMNRMSADIAARSKIVLIVRNPKDTAVSYFCHMKRAEDFKEEESWNHFQSTFLTGPVVFGPYTDYLKSFEKEIQKENGPKIHVVYYEDLKLDGLREMRKIQKHLGLNHSDERLQAIVDRCSINRLRDDVITGRTETSIRDAQGNSVLYRKGEVGDWKNYFTVAENEAFDTEWETQMKNSMFQFRYT